MLVEFPAAADDDFFALVEVFYALVGDGLAVEWPEVFAGLDLRAVGRLEDEVDQDDLATPVDFDLYYDPVLPGALAQINFEEARRLYWLSGLSGVDGVALIVPDTGLADGSSEDCLLDVSTWTSGEHTLTITAVGASSNCSTGAIYHAC